MRNSIPEGLDIFDVFNHGNVSIAIVFKADMGLDLEDSGHNWRVNFHG